MWSVFSEFAKRRASSLPDRKSTRLNSSHSQISYAVFCLKKIKRFLRWNHLGLELYSSSTCGVDRYLDLAHMICNLTPPQHQALYHGPLRLPPMHDILTQLTR